MTPKDSEKEKCGMNLIGITIFLIYKILKRKRREAADGEKIFANYISGKGPKSRIYE